MERKERFDIPRDSSGEGITLNYVTIVAITNTRPKKSSGFANEIRQAIWDGLAAIPNAQWKGALASRNLFPAP